MIATSIEQSKQLVRLGLDQKTADMWWSNRFVYWQPTPMIGISTEQHQLYTFKWCDEDVPAWSLSALLEVMPSNIGDYDLYITKHKYVDGGYGYNVEYNRGFTINVLHKGTSRDLVTAAYEMVCWLLTNNLITNN